MLFLSVSYFVNPFKKFGGREYLHFAIPFLLLLMVLLTTIDGQREIVEEVELANTANYFLGVVFSIQVMLYCIFTYFKIKNYQHHILQINSNTENKNLQWLRNLVLTILAMAFFWILDFSWQLSISFASVDDITNGIYILGVLYVTYHWQHQKELFSKTIRDNEELGNLLTNKNTEETSIKPNLATSEETEQLKWRLENMMLQEKPYLQPELTLFDLAAKLNISAHQLSFLINQVFGQNFNSFINQHRVEEAKRLLIDDKLSHLNLLGIGFEAGFNSKTAFNTTFKKMTGLTPSAYKKENEKNKKKF